MRIPSGVTDQYIYFVAVDATDFTTRETGLATWTVYRSRNGAAAAAMTTPTINETDTTNMPGVYELLLDEDMTIDAGDDSQEMAFHITHTGMAPVTRTIELYRSKITAGNTLGVASDGDISGNLDGTVATVATLTGHTAQTGDNFARLGAPAGASISADIATVKTDTAAILIDTAEIGVAGAGLSNINLPNQTMDIIGNITGNLSGSVGSVTGAVGSVTGHTAQTGDSFAIVSGPAGLVAIDTVVDAIKVVTDALGSAAAAKLALSAAGIIPGTAVTGTLTTTVMTTDLTGFADDKIIGREVIWTGGTADGQSSNITDYASASGTITYEVITTAPLNNDPFVVV